MQITNLHQVCISLDSHPVFTIDDGRLNCTFALRYSNAQDHPDCSHGILESSTNSFPGPQFIDLI